MKLEPHERTFEVHPIGVDYVCEFCNEGTMMVDTTQPVVNSNPPMYPHVCRNCGKTMLLPKVYPMIHWETEFDKIEE